MTVLPESITSSKEFKRKSMTARYTRENWDLALRQLRLGKSVANAAVAAGCSRQTLCDWRDRNEQTRSEWHQAIETGTDLCEDEAHRRAVEGVDKPVFGSGGRGEGTVQVGVVTEYSDNLLTTLLKARRPKVYRDSVTVSGDPDSPIIHGVKVVFVQGGAPGPQTIEHEEPEHE